MLTCPNNLFKRLQNLHPTVLLVTCQHEMVKNIVCPLIFVKIIPCGEKRGYFLTFSPQEFRKSSLNPAYDLRRLALMPLGGSTVIFEPFCRMKTGNLSLGMLVSHKRKSRWTWSKKKQTLLVVIFFLRHEDPVKPLFKRHPGPLLCQTVKKRKKEKKKRQLQFCGK